MTWQEHTVKCTVQISTQNTAQLFGQFGQFGQIVECSFKNYVVLGSNSVAIKCCILGTRSTYSPVNFNWELVDRKLFLHFSKSLANILAESLVYIFFLCFHFFIFTLHNKTLVYVSYLFSFGIYFFHEQWFYNFFDSSNFCYIKPQ